MIDKALDERTIGHNPERLCLMKGGMVYANAVTTVSPAYAREALEGGAAGFLRTVLSEPHVRGKFAGVLNGIDTAAWCPSLDKTLPAPFNSAAPQVGGVKGGCGELRQRCGLSPVPTLPSGQGAMQALPADGPRPGCGP